MNQSTTTIRRYCQVLAGAAFALGLSLAPRMASGAWNDPAAGSPIIQSHDLAEAGTQGPAWAFAETANGTLLVGADQIAEFDGHRWRKVMVPGGYAIRGLAREIKASSALENGSRIYFGAIGGLGYVDFDRQGRSTLVSLTPQLKEAGFKLPAEFWQVQATEQGILFVGDQEILRWIPEPGPVADTKAQGRFEQWILPSEPRLQAFSVGHDLWFFQADVGLRRMGKNGPETLIAASELPEKAFVWALAGADSPTGDGLLLGTSTAVYVRRNGRFEKLETLSAAIAGKLPVCAVPLDAERLAIGTYLAGVIVVTRSGQVDATIDRSRGLPDDHVETLWLDGQGGMWAGLTETVARVPVAATVSRFDARNGLGEGPTKEVISQGTETFAITSKSVFGLHPKEATPGFAAEPGLTAFFWDAATAGEHLLLAGYGGIWVKSPAGFKPPPPKPDEDSTDAPARATTTSGATPSGWRHEYYVSGEVTSLLATRPERPMVFFTEGKAVKALEMTASGWVPRDLRQKLTDTPLSMALDGKGDLWVSMVRGQIVRFSLIQDGLHRPYLVLEKVLNPGEGLPADIERPRLCRVGSGLFAFTTTGIFRLNQDRTMFVSEVALADCIGLAAAESRTAGSAYWLVQRKSQGEAGPASLRRLTLDKNGLLTAEALAVDGLSAIGRISSISVTEDAGSEVLWIGGSAALLRIRTKDITPAGPLPEAYVRTIAIDGHEELGSETALTLPPKSEKIRIELATRGAAAGGNELFYQTRVVGLESDWSAPTLTAERSYTGLPSGHYVFRVRTMDSFGRTGPEYTLAIVVPIPVWRQWPALAAYTLVIAACIAFGVRWRLRRLRQDTARLNQLVEERTQDLAERTKELELSNTAKEEFLENISHEIRNPLNGVRGLAGMLRETPLPPQQRELTASLAACASALTRVFDEVLNFAKLEAGQKPVQKRAFSLPALIDEVIALHRVTARQRDSEITATYEEVTEEPVADGANGHTPPSRRFVGDDDRIKTIVSNFVSNALKYAPGKPIEIAVECRPEGKRSCDVTIAVRDHGAGVPWEEQPLVFNKFVRGSNAKAQRVPGTGLGLATCKALAEQMGAFVGLDSEPGKGASFFLKVQLRREPETAEPESLVEANPVPTKSRRALVIEDQDYNQLITLRIAQKLGLEPEVAQDGAEAMRKFAKGAYAVLFVDWEMPGLKGNEIARHVRQLPWGADAIIIATTGHDSEAVRTDCFEAGMDAFVAKPFDEETMARALESARARRGQATDIPMSANRLNLRVFSLVGEDDPTKIERAAVDYLASMQDELTAIDLALAASDWPVAAGAAHRLKSHAGFVSASELQQAAEAFEQTIEQAEPESRARLRDKLFVQADRVRLQVEARIT